MLQKLIISAVVVLVCTGGVFAGQCTGGDKIRRTATSGLNPQPLPPGRHRYRSNHHHHHRHGGRK